MGYPKGKARNPGITQDENAAIKALVGKPLALESEADKNAAARMAVLLKHIAEKSKPVAENHYRSNFHAFLTEMCFTKDEAAAGRVAKMPAYPYFPDLCDDLITKSPLLVDKSRRVLASWVVCCFDLWLVAGGYDPRWPELMPNGENPDGRNRKVVVASQKLEGEAGSAWFLSERIRYVVEQIEERGLRETHWPEFPVFSWKFGRAEASNGGVIAAIAQGADQARGLGATFVHIEELASWSEARASIGTILPTLRGGGKLCAITTARAATYAALIVQGKLKETSW